MWTFIILMFGALVLGASFLGVVGATAMLKGRRWGLRVGMAAAILFEVFALINAILALFVIAVTTPSAVPDYVLFLWFVVAVVPMSAGIVLAYLLSRESVICGMGQEPRYLAGGWAMAVPAILTVVGTPAAIGLLRNRRWGRVAMMVFLVICGLDAVEIAILLLPWTVAIIPLLVVIWCLAGFVYLNSPEARAWFDARDSTTEREPWHAGYVLLMIVALVLVGILFFLEGNYGYSVDPTWAPDGQMIAFESYRNGAYGAHVLNLDGEVEYLLPHDYMYDLAWSPDGNHIAYSGDCGRSYGLCVMDYSGNNARALGETRGQSPTWSPDGLQIAFEKENDIYILDTESNELRQLTSDYRWIGSLAWSPDGQSIAFEARGDGNTAGIYVMNPSGAGLRPLIDASVSTSDPTWSPDGLQIAFETGDDIYIMNADGSDPRHLAGCPAGYCTDLAWSPNGQQIAFTGLREEGFTERHEIYVVDVDTGGYHRVTESRRVGWLPAWDWLDFW